MNGTDLLAEFRATRAEAAFSELVRRHTNLVYSIAKRRVVDVTLAQEVTQIVFIRLAKAPPKLDLEAQLLAWLHRTTVNVTIDTWRSETRRRNREQQAMLMEANTPEDAVWEDISPNLDEALNQLNDQDRQALVLRFFSGKAMREVGAALAVSEDAAKMRVRRALDRLRTQLGVGGAACTAAVLETILDAHSAQAAPVQLVSRLAAMKLPAAPGAGGGGGPLDAFLRIPKLKLAAGAVVLALIGVSTVHFLRWRSAPVPEAASESPTVASGNAAAKAGRERFDPSGFNASVTPTTKAVKVLF